MILVITFTHLLLIGAGFFFILFANLRDQREARREAAAVVPVVALSPAQALGATKNIVPPPASTPRSPAVGIELEAPIPDERDAQEVHDPLLAALAPDAVDLPAPNADAQEVHDPTL